MHGQACAAGQSVMGRRRVTSSAVAAVRACRLLVEAAWHHRKSYRNPSTVMQARWDQATPAARSSRTARPAVPNPRISV
jgi:hypothetical protein